MTDAAETKNQRVIIVRQDVTPQYVMCEDCKAYEKFRRHPSEGTGECRRFSPRGIVEPLGASASTFRAKWPIVFRDEGCFEGIVKKPTEKVRAV